MCDEWRRIDELAGLVIGRLESHRGTRETALSPARSTAVERVATDSQREGRLPVARAQGEGGDPPNAICETERTGAAKAPAKLEEIRNHKEPSPVARPVLRVVVDNSRRGRTHRPNEVSPRLGVRPRMLLVVSGGH